MHLSALLDCDLVAVEHTDELTLLVELTAPSPATTAVRQPATLQVVLDRSGSMSGERLDGAKSALVDLVDRLDPADRHSASLSVRAESLGRGTKTYSRIRRPISQF